MSASKSHGEIKNLRRNPCAAGTNRKKAEQATQAASRYSLSLIEASLDPLVTISAEGKITDVNTATEEVTGANRDLLIGSDFADYFNDPQKAREGVSTGLLARLCDRLPAGDSPRFGQDYGRPVQRQPVP